MIRHCDGTDPNLTRAVRDDEILDETTTVNPAWGFTAKPGEIIINCQCGASFDDVDHLVTYPHEAF